MSRLRSSAVLLSVSSALAAISLTGCAGMITTATPGAVAGVSLSGSVHGGQQPVTGSHVYLFAAGAAGYGSASVSLLGTGTSQSGLATDSTGTYTTTNSSGSFTITNNYLCPTSASQVYLLATGGNPGLVAGTNNAAITLMAALGSCSNLSSSTFTIVNEVTTAAAVTALQQFMANPTHVGSSPGNTLGLQNAFLAVTNLSDAASGSARTSPAGGTGSSPAAKLNTLGDILAPCINSASSSSSACTSLFSAATPAGGTAPSDTANAMLLIAKNPANNVASLFAQVNAAAPFPGLSSAPNDYTLPVVFTGGGLSSPGDVVIDANGNAWTANCPSCNNVRQADSLVGFSPIGAVLSGATGFTSGIHAPQGIAFDAAGNLWSVNQASGINPDSVVKMSSTGTVAPGFPYTSTANLELPVGIAFDGASNAWITNSAGSPQYGIPGLVALSNSGTVLTTVNNNSLIGSSGVGVDSSNFVFVAAAASNDIYKTNVSGSTSATYTNPGIQQPLSIAIDSSDNVWTLLNVNALSVISGATGAAITSNVGVSSSQATVIAIDGASTGWVANCRVSCPGNTTTRADNLLHFNINGTDLTHGDGFQDASLLAAGVAAIDASGNVWVSDNQGGSLTEFVGVAAPVRTPLSVAQAAGQLGTRP